MPLKVHTDEAPTINLTSMIDVVFLLLIFFMVGTKFTEMESDVVLELPRVAEGANASPQSSMKTVSVFRDGAVSFDNRTMTLPELTQVMYQLRQQNPQTSVAVRSDAALTIQRVMEVATAIKKAGIQRLSFTTSQSTMSR
jgi:biopolymer transport protein ExbD